MKRPFIPLLLLALLAIVADGILILIKDEKLTFIILAGILISAFLFILWKFLLMKAVEKQTVELLTEIEEKNVFIREIHHRVKYNFNILSTLINIQNEQISSIDSAHRALTDLNSRIKSMTLIHDKLYDAEDISRIDMAYYFMQLHEQLKTQFPEDEPPVLNIESEKIFLGINTAVPCGLLINEILFLSMSYARVKGESLDIKVRMFEDDEGYTLVISDSGLDMREWPAVQDIDFSIMLIHQLAGKLYADIDISFDKGNNYLVEFYADPR